MIPPPAAHDGFTIWLWLAVVVDPLHLWIAKVKPAFGWPRQVVG